MHPYYSLNLGAIRREGHDIQLHQLLKELHKMSVRFGGKSSQKAKDASLETPYKPELTMTKVQLRRRRFICQSMLNAPIPSSIAVVGSGMLLITMLST